MKKNLLIALTESSENCEFSLSFRRNFSLVYVCVILFAAVQLLAANANANSDEVLPENRSVQTSPVKEDLRELKPGETIERQAEATEIHGYQIALEAGTAVEITFGKRNISPQLTALVPDNTDYSVPGNKIPAGKELARVIAGTSEYLVEPMIIVAEKPGNYIITARFLSSGTYQITSSLPHAVTETDKKYAAAGKLFAEIRQSLESGKPFWSLREKLEQRAAIYRDLDDKKSLALSLNDVGRVYESNVEFNKAINYYKEALELFRSLNASRNIGENLYLIGRISTSLGNYQTAVESYQERLTLSRALTDKQEEAGVLHSLGVIYHLLADEQSAREYYEQSLLIKKTLEFNPINADPVTLINIGNLYRGVEADEIVVEAFGPRTAADRQKALEYYLRALEVAKETQKSFPGTRTRENYILLLVGNTYKELGNYTEAVTYLNKALGNYKAANSSAGQIYTRMGLGNLYVLKGEHQKGFEYLEQATTIVKSESGNNYHRSQFLNAIAQDYYRAGETQKAIDLINEALTISRARGQQVVAAASLFELARIERELGNFNNARNRIEEAIAISESLRAKITAQEIRTTYFSSVKRYYDFYVDLLMQARKSQPEKGFDAMALQASEKARSRSLIDLLTLSRIDIKQGVDSELLEREKQLQSRLAEKANQQSRLLFAKHTAEEAKKISEEVSNLTAEYEKTQTEIRNKSPRYAALTQPQPLSAQQIQQLLDSGTILLEYSLGEKKSYLWAVTSDSITSFDLASRDEIETAARRVYELLTARNQRPLGETDEQRRIRVRTADEEFSKASAKLSEMLLAPVVSQIGNKRLLIVPDGALNYIPFSSLPTPKTGNSIKSMLGINHEIVMLPSASTLARLREETFNRQPAPKMLAIFADPVFSQTDNRADSVIAGQRKTNTKQKDNSSQLNARLKTPIINRDFERAVSDTGLSLNEFAALPRLPFSRREADSIFKIAPKNLSVQQVDFKASKSKVFASDLNQYRMLHFATHGLLNSRHPELSGIVLSLIDENGRDIDGFLRLQDIYNLKLSADLVVLSACNTALGKDVKGEGLIGLTRGFMYAGSPRVVASLWKVNDAATAELMTIFYRKLLTENLRPAAALRAAQIEMMKQSRYKSPYFWAPFIIQGEWR